MMTKIQSTTTATCPECGTETDAEMPTDRCVVFWDCPSCGTTLRPNPGDCCVFCSYGTVPCPPEQSGDDCCLG